MRRSRWWVETKLSVCGAPEARSVDVAWEGVVGVTTAVKVRRPSKPKWSTVQQVAAQWAEQLRTMPDARSEQEAARAFFRVAYTVTAEDLNQRSFFRWAQCWLEAVVGSPGMVSAEARMDAAVDRLQEEYPGAVLRWLETAVSMRLQRVREMHDTITRVDGKEPTLMVAIDRALRKECTEFLRLFHRRLVEAAKQVQADTARETA